MKQRYAELVVFGGLLAFCPLAGWSLELGPLTVRSSNDQSLNTDVDLAPATDAETKVLENNTANPSSSHEQAIPSTPDAESSLDNSARGSATLDTTAVERRNWPYRMNKLVTRGRISAVVVEPVPALGVAVAIEIPAPVAMDAMGVKVPTSDVPVSEQSLDEFAEPVTPADAPD